MVVQVGCKGICVRYKAKKPGKESRYENGQKRCQICDIFIYWSGSRCPCCNYMLKTRNRHEAWEKRAVVTKMVPLPMQQA